MGRKGRRAGSGAAPRGDVHCAPPPRLQSGQPRRRAAAGHLQRLRCVWGAAPTGQALPVKAKDAPPSSP